MLALAPEAVRALRITSEQHWAQVTLHMAAVSLQSAGQRPLHAIVSTCQLGVRMLGAPLRCVPGLFPPRASSGAKKECVAMLPAGPLCYSQAALLLGRLPVMPPMPCDSPYFKGGPDTKGAGSAHNDYLNLTLDHFK